MDLGNLEIGLGLDLSQIDQQLDQLESRKPIKLPLQLSQDDLEKAKRNLGSLSVDLSTERAQKALEDLRRQFTNIEVSLDTTYAQRQLQSLLKPLVITTQLDLQAFETQLKRLETLTKSTLSQLENAAIKSTEQTYKIKVEAANNKLISALHDNSKSHVNQAPKAFQEVLKTTKLKLDRGGLLGRAASGIATGGFEGVGRRGGETLFRNIEARLEVPLKELGVKLDQRFEVDSKRIFKDLGEVLGFQSADIFKKRIGELGNLFTPNYSDLREQVEKAFDIYKKVKIETEVDGKQVGTAIKDAFKESSDDLQKRLSIALLRAAGTLSKAIFPFIQVEKEIKLRKEGVDLQPSSNLDPVNNKPEAELTPEQIQRAVEKGVAVISIGGFQGLEGEASRAIQPEIQGLFPNAEILNLRNSWRDAKKRELSEIQQGIVDFVGNLMVFASAEAKAEIKKEIAQKLRGSSGTALETEILGGVSPESKRAAAIAETLLVAGVKEIVITGYSGGTLDSRDAISMLNYAGRGDQVQGLAFGGPLVGGVNASQDDNYTNLLGKPDSYYKILFQGSSAAAQKFIKDYGQGLEGMHNALFKEFLENMMKAATGTSLDADTQSGIARAFGFNQVGAIVPELGGIGHQLDSYIADPNTRRIAAEISPQASARFVPGFKLDDPTQRRSGQAAGNNDYLAQTFGVMGRDIEHWIVELQKLFARQDFGSLLPSLLRGSQTLVDPSLDFEPEDLTDDERKRMKSLKKFTAGPIRDFVEYLESTNKELTGMLAVVGGGGQLGEGDVAKIRQVIESIVVIRNYTGGMAKEYARQAEFAASALDNPEILTESLKIFSDPTLLNRLGGVGDQLENTFLDFLDAVEEAALDPLLLERSKINLGQKNFTNDIGLRDVTQYEVTRPGNPWDAIDVAATAVPATDRETKERDFLMLLEDSARSIQESIERLEAKINDIDTSAFDKALAQAINDLKARLDALFDDVSKNLEVFQHSIINAEETLDFLSLKIQDLPLEQLSKNLSELVGCLTEVEQHLQQIAPDLADMQSGLTQLNTLLNSGADQFRQLNESVDNSDRVFVDLAMTALELKTAFEQVTRSITAFQKVRESEFLEGVSNLIGEIPLGSAIAGTPPPQQPTEVSGETRRDDATPGSPQAQTGTTLNEFAEAIERITSAIEIDAKIVEQTTQRARKDKLRLTSIPTGNIDLESASLGGLKALRAELRDQLKQQKQEAQQRQAQGLRPDTDFTKLLEADIKSLTNLIRSLQKVRDVPQGFAKKETLPKAQIVEVEAETLDRRVEEFSSDRLTPSEEDDLQSQRLQEIANAFERYLNDAGSTQGLPTKQDFINYWKQQDHEFSKFYRDAVNGKTETDRFEDAFIDAVEAQSIDELVSEMVSSMVIDQVQTLIIENLQNIKGLENTGAGPEAAKKEQFTPKADPDFWAAPGQTAEQAKAEADERFQRIQKRIEEIDLDPDLTPLEKEIEKKIEEISAGLATYTRADLTADGKLSEEAKQRAREQMLNSMDNSSQEQELRQRESKTRLETIRENVRDIAVIGGILERIVDKAQKDLLQLEKQEDRRFKENPNLREAKSRVQTTLSVASEAIGEARDKTQSYLRSTPETATLMLSGTADGITDVQTVITQLSSALSDIEQASLGAIPGLGRLKDELSGIQARLSQPLDAMGDGIQGIRDRLDGLLQPDFIGQGPKTETAEGVNKRISQLNKETGRLKGELARNPGKLELFEAIEAKSLRVLKTIKDAQSELKILAESGGTLSENKGRQANLGRQQGISRNRLIEDNRKLIPTVAAALKQGESKENLVGFVGRLIKGREETLALLRQQGGSEKEVKAIEASLPNLHAFYDKLSSIPKDTLEGLAKAEFEGTGRQQAKQYKESFEKALGIQSPSKAFEYIGEMSATGLDRGFQPDSLGIFLEQFEELKQQTSKSSGLQFFEDLQQYLGAVNTALADALAKANKLELASRFEAVEQRIDRGMVPSVKQSLEATDQYASNRPSEGLLPASTFTKTPDLANYSYISRFRQLEDIVSSLEGGYKSADNLQETNQKYWKSRDVVYGTVSDNPKDVGSTMYGYQGLRLNPAVMAARSTWTAQDSLYDVVKGAHGSQAIRTQEHGLPANKTSTKAEYAEFQLSGVDDIWNSVETLFIEFEHEWKALGAESRSMLLAMVARARGELKIGDNSVDFSKFREEEKFSGSQAIARGDLSEANLKKAVSELPSLLKPGSEIGKDLILGIQQGIQQYEGMLLDDAAGSAHALIKTIKRVLRIQSPSKEGEDIGANWGLGLIKGAESLYRKLEVLTGGLGKKIVDLLNNSGDGVENAAQNLGAVAGRGVGELPVQAVRAVKRTKAAFDQLPRNAAPVSAFLGSFRSQFKQTFEALKAELPILGRLSSNFKSLGVELLQTIGIFSIGDLLADQAREGVAKMLELSRATTKLTTTLGSRQLAETFLSGAEKDADRLGLSIRTTRDQLAQLSAATRGTPLASLAPQLSDSLSKASSALSVGPEGQQRAATALAQIAGKGILSQEEIRQQLGEAIPGITAILAKAYGVTVSELNKKIESGSLTSIEALPILTKALDVEFDFASLDAAGKSLNAFQNRVQNSIQLAQEGLGSFALNAAPLVAPFLAGFDLISKNIELVAALLVGKLAGNLTSLVVKLGLFPKTVDRAGDAVANFRLKIASLSNQKIGDLFSSVKGSGLESLKSGAASALGGIKSLGVGLAKTVGPAYLAAGAFKAGQFALNALVGDLDESSQKLVNFGERFKEFRGELELTTLELEKLGEKDFDLKLSTGAKDFVKFLGQLITLDIEGASQLVQNKGTTPGTYGQQFIGPFGKSSVEQSQRETFTIEFAEKQGSIDALINSINRKLAKKDNFGRVDFDAVKADLKLAKSLIEALETYEKKAIAGDSEASKLLEETGGKKTLELLRAKVLELNKAAISGGNFADKLTQISKNLSKLDQQKIRVSTEGIERQVEALKRGFSDLKPIELKFAKKNKNIVEEEATSLGKQLFFYKGQLNDPAFQKRLASPDAQVADQAANQEKDLRTKIEETEKNLLEKRKEYADATKNVIELEKELVQLGIDRRINEEAFQNSLKQKTTLQNTKEFTFSDDAAANALEIKKARAELNAAKKGSADEFSAAKKRLIDAEIKEETRLLETRKQGFENDKALAANGISQRRLASAQLEAQGVISVKQRARKTAEIEVAEQGNTLKDLKEQRARLLADFDANPNKKSNQAAFNKEKFSLDGNIIQAEIALLDARLNLQKADREQQVELLDIAQRRIQSQETLRNLSMDIKKQGLETIGTVATALESIGQSVTNLRLGAIQGTIDLLANAKDFSFDALTQKDGSFREAKKLITELNGFRRQRGMSLLSLADIDTRKEREQALMGLTRRKVMLELENIKKQDESLKRRQALAQKLLDLEIEKQKVADKAALRTARAELRKAELGGDATQIEIAKIGVEEAEKTIVINSESEYMQRAALAAEQMVEKQEQLATNLQKTQELRSLPLGEQFSKLSKADLEAFSDPLQRQINNAEKRLLDPRLEKEAGSAIQATGLPGLGVFPDKPSTRADIAKQLGLDIGTPATKGSDIASQLNLRKSVVDTLKGLESSVPSQPVAQIKEAPQLQSILDKITRLMEVQKPNQVTLNTTVEKRGEAGQIEREVLGALNSAFRDLAGGI